MPINKKIWYLLVDTETSETGKVLDFGALLVDKQGRTEKTLACLVSEVYTTERPFFSDEDGWNLARRQGLYRSMLADGRRSLHSIAAINKWLEKIRDVYNPVLTAYNLPFDSKACKKTGIIMPFSKSFDLYAEAAATIARTKKYLQFCLDRHLFNPPTSGGNCTLKCTAETIGGYLGAVGSEPHTAFEDCQHFEALILKKILSLKPAKVLTCQPARPANWRDRQVKDLYTVK